MEEETLFPAILLHLDYPLVCVAYGLLEWFELKGHLKLISFYLCHGRAPAVSPFLEKGLYGEVCVPWEGDIMGCRQSQNDQKWDSCLSLGG